MTKYFIVLINWDILNKGRIKRNLFTLKSDFNEIFSLYISIDVIVKMWDSYFRYYLHSHLLKKN